MGYFQTPLARYLRDRRAGLSHLGIIPLMNAIIDRGGDTVER